MGQTQGQNEPQSEVTMNTRYAGLALAMFLMVPGCIPAGQLPDDQVPFDPDPDACGASGLQGLVGQPETVLQSMRFSQRLRMIQPGMMITQDYSPERLNISVDASGMIESVSCG
jgi:hypothetical protein